MMKRRNNKRRRRRRRRRRGRRRRGRGRRLGDDAVMSCPVDGKVKGGNRGGGGGGRFSNVDIDGACIQ